MKKYLIVVITFYTMCLFSAAKIPVFIESQEKVFHKIAYEMNSKLPKKIDIMVCNILFLNGDKNNNDKINKNFGIILESQQFIYKYTITMIKNVKMNDASDDFSFVENYDEQELIAFAQFSNTDAILIASVTILEDQNKKARDNETKKTTNKKISLIQGNVFNTESKDSMFRFSYYFLID